MKFPLTFDKTVEDTPALEPVIDRTGRRFGTGAIRPGALLTVPGTTRDHLPVQLP